ncbi:MAG: Maf family protein [Hyphomonadaceae bacterium]
MSKPEIILASGSASRRALLENAGVDAVAVKSLVDEEPVREAMRRAGNPVRDQAMQLAELKAIKVSQSREGLVIGGDQMLALGERAFDKPRNMAEARRHLEALSGQSHRLETAVVVAEGGQIVWRHLARPELTMRPLSDQFIETYLADTGEVLLQTVGAYMLESTGIQLFSEIKGDYFSILGLPILPLLDYFRVRDVLIP